MSIFKNRTVIGVICILLALVICFGITPLFNQSISQKSEIVRVAKGIPPCAQLLGAAQSGCTGRADTAVGLVHGHKPLVARRNGIAQGGGTVRGAVVHQNAPKGVKFLCGNGIGAGGQKRRRVMYRHNDCNLAGLHFVTSA